MTAEARVARSSWLYLRVVEERQVTGPRFFDARDPMDIELAVAFEATTESLRNLVEFQPSQYTTTFRTGRRVGSLS